MRTVIQKAIPEKIKLERKYGPKNVKGKKKIIWHFNLAISFNE